MRSMPAGASFSLHTECQGAGHSFGFLRIGLACSPRTSVPLPAKSNDIAAVCVPGSDPHTGGHTESEPAAHQESNTCGLSDLDASRERQSVAQEWCREARSSSEALKRLDSLVIDLVEQLLRKFYA